MSLSGALQIGRSALVASQAGLQVAGHNMANAATVGFHRQSMHLAPARGDVVGRGTQVGRGVQILAIRREIDSALQSRSRDAISQHSRDLISQRFLTSIESLQNELSNNDVSSLLSTFFNNFSELANNPEDNAVRSVVIQEGVNLASRIASLRSDYNSVIHEIDRSLGVSIQRANDLLDQIAYVNSQIIQAEGAGGQIGEANSLRDQRDILIDELAGYIDISVVEPSGGGGGVEIFVGSTPILLGGQSRGLELRTQNDGNSTIVSLRVAADGTKLSPASGSIGGLMAQREQTVQPAINALDEFASQLIFQVNRLHSQGQGRQGFASLTGSYRVADPTATLNSSAAGLPLGGEGAINNGSFFIHLTHAETGVRTTHQIMIDGDAMSLNDVISQINGVSNVTASTSVAGELRLDGAAGFEISFSDDTSGALAALGVNTFFTGADAGDIGVNQILRDNPGMLAAGAGHVAGSNGTAMAIVGLQHASLDSLNGKSLREYWQHEVNSLAVKANAANSAVDSSRMVKESLNAQVQAVSGVSLDEEAINLMTFQRQFQAAARFISVIDETLQTLLSIA